MIPLKRNRWKYLVEPREKARETARSKRNAIQPVDSSSSSRSSLHFSALKKAHKQRVIPELREEDLDETFVRGSGPGGQSINKTENNVQLLHKPTGIRVSCQESRSLALNRRLARRLMVGKLDKVMNPGLSKEEFLRARERERGRRRRKKAKKKKRENEALTLRSSDP